MKYNNELVKIQALEERIFELSNLIESLKKDNTGIFFEIFFSKYNFLIDVTNSLRILEEKYYQ